MELLATSLGVIGVAMILMGYAGQQFGRMKSNGSWYLWLNLVGSLLILYSLVYEFNLPAFIIEVAWVLITLYSFSQRWKMKRKKPKKSRKKR